MTLPTRRRRNAALNENCAGMGAMTRRRTAGRPSKGDRDHFAVKTPIDLGEFIRDRADELEVSYNDLLLSLIAKQLGFPQYAPDIPEVVPAKHPELPIAAA